MKMKKAAKKEIKKPAKPSESKKVALAAMLGALSAVARVPFAALPSVQPSTFIIASSGYSFGILTGLTVGVLTAVLSSFFLGFGPWTLFQALAWGMVGVFFGLIGRLFKASSSRRSIIILASFGFLWGYIFGFIMNLWYLMAFGFPMTLKSIIAVQAASFWMDTLHAISNATLILVFGKRVINLFGRYRQRFFLRQGSK